MLNPRLGRAHSCCAISLETDGRRTKRRMRLSSIEWSTPPVTLNSVPESFTVVLVAHSRRFQRERWSRSGCCLAEISIVLLPSKSSQKPERTSLARYWTKGDLFTTSCRKWFTCASTFRTFESYNLVDHLQALRCRCRSNVILQGSVLGARPTMFGTTWASDFYWMAEVLSARTPVDSDQESSARVPLGRLRRCLENGLHPSLDLIGTTASPK